MGSMFDYISVSRSRKNMESILCVYPQGPVTTVCFIFQRIANRRSDKNSYMDIHSSMIHSKPKGGSNPIVRRQVKDKQNVVHPYSGILFVFQKNKRTEILTHATIQMNHENTINKVRRKKINTVCFHLQEVPKRVSDP